MSFYHERYFVLWSDYWTLQILLPVIHYFPILFIDLWHRTEHYTPGLKGHFTTTTNSPSFFWHNLICKTVNNLIQINLVCKMFRVHVFEFVLVWYHLRTLNPWVVLITAQWNDIDEKEHSPKRGSLICGVEIMAFGTGENEFDKYLMKKSTCCSHSPDIVSHILDCYWKLLHLIIVLQF